VSAPAVRFAGITRRFPGVAALTDVGFDVAAGSCHAICGENGAGKSTLGRILAGIDRPDAGTITLFGEAVRFRQPRDAMAAGVAIVHQELALWPELSVAENLGMGRMPRRGPLVDRRALRAHAEALLARVGAAIDPDRRMGALSIAEQQLVQIAMAVGADARIIIFDEPTSSLGERETERLYAVMAALRAQGTTTLYVSHRMPEIFRLCDTVTVLRDGHHVATTPTAALDEAAIVEQMIGRRLEQFYPSHAAGTAGAPVLEVEGLSAAGGRVRDISFTLRAGEVLGLAGLVGAGRSEVARALFGLDPTARGRVRVRGREATIRSPREAMALGLGLVPEDRKGQGLVLGMANRENGSLPSLPRFASRGVVDRARESAATGAAFAAMTMAADAEAATVTLSGGNQQKVVMAKWLTAESDLLILDEPTRGVDVGAKAELHAWIDRHAAAGGAVLLITSDMPELLNLATRILVLREGRPAGELARADATQASLLRLMSGLGAA